MQGCVAFVISLEHLIDEDRPAHNKLQAFEGIVFCCNVEHSFKFIVPQLKVLSTLGKLLLKHGQIVLLQRVVKRKGSIVVRGIRSWVDLVYQGMLACHTNNVLHGASLVVLHSPRFKVLICAHEPSEHSFIA